MYFITVPECEEALRKMDKDMVVLRENRTLIPQLLAIPQGSEVMATVPECWTTAQKERFTLEVYEALNSIEISRNTIATFTSEWESNAFWNYEKVCASTPIDQLKIKFPEFAQKTALIVGSGPSAKIKLPDGMISYAAWSAKSYEGEPSFIGHCDAREQVHTDKMPTHGIIYSPVASKEFPLAFPKSDSFVYFDRGNRAAWRFAQKLSLPDHIAIVGHVVDMLTHCAIYGGHKKIKFIGLDLCATSIEELKQYHPTINDAYERQNYKGEVVFTDDIFMVFQKGIESFVDRYPEIEFVNGNENGLILEGIPYEPFN